MSTKSNLPSGNVTSKATAPSKATNIPPSKRERTALGIVHQVQQVQPTSNTTKIMKSRVTRSSTRATIDNSKTSRVSAAIQAAVQSKISAKEDVPATENCEDESSKPPARRTRAAGKPPIKTSKSVTSARVISKSDEDNNESADRVVEVPNSVVTVVPDPVVEKVTELKKPLVIAEPSWDDLDADDISDPLMVSEYVVEIFDYMKELEIATMPNPDYMESQKELQWKMRAILIDWLIDVHNKFRLLPETLYLAVNIIDRFLSLRVVSLVKLQLVGITSMFIAAKYEEVIAPSVKNFIYMADNGYTDEEILRAERYVLQVLDFNLQYPSPMSFLRRCSKAEQYDVQTRTLAKYLMEISLVDHAFLSIVPSKVAAAGLYLARKMLNRGEWDRNLTHYSSYSEEEIEECVRLMMEYLEKPCKHEALYKKYASKKFMKASIFVREWLAKQNEEDSE